MDLKELNKTQLVLLTLLITFVVSIATAIVTVSLMKQMPKDIPQTINNVIERTIEKVTTVQTPKVETQKNTETKTNSDDSALFLGEGNVLIPIYNIGQVTEEKINSIDQNVEQGQDNQFPQALGDGVIISDVGLVLTDTNILNDSSMYNIILNKKIFEILVLKKFNNGFTVLKISPIVEKPVVEENSQSKSN